MGVVIDGRSTMRPMGKIDVHAIAEQSGSRYPAPFHEPCMPRAWKRLGDAAGLTQFGVNLLRLPPGAWSSQRHWHAEEDEFVYVLEGAVVLVSDDGEEPLGPGDCAGFPAGERNGHCIQNRGGEAAILLVVGSRRENDRGEYSDIDMTFERGPEPGSVIFRHKDGTPYPRREPPAPR